MFLRPLTIRRRFEQVVRFQLPLERSVLVILTIITALTSAAIVALFGIRASVEQVVNPVASFPLDSLNSSFFEIGPGGGTYPVGSPASFPNMGLLSGFLYKAAYITGLKMRGNYNAIDPYVAYIPEAGPLGDTIYANLHTGGIGLNTSSYLQYSGGTDGFAMPARYEFNELRGTVFGTNVEVTCRDVSPQYTVKVETFWQFGDMNIASIAKPGGANMMLFGNLDSYNILYTLTIGSEVLIKDDGDPVNLLAIPNFGTEEATVFECEYGGREYTADIVLSSPVSPLEIRRTHTLGPYLGPYVKQSIANITNSLISAGMGGNLALGFLDADYNTDSYNNTGMDKALEPVLESLGEAYFSLMRQKVERSTLYTGGQFDSVGADVRLSVTVNRLGGGQFGWLAVLGLLLLETLAGTVRICIGTQAVDFEAQDTVKSLRSMMNDPSVSDTSKVGYRKTIEILGKGK